MVAEYLLTDPLLETLRPTYKDAAKIEFQKWVSQSVKIQLPSLEDEEELLQNIQQKKKK